MQHAGMREEFRRLVVERPDTGCWDWTMYRSNLGYAHTRRTWGLFPDSRTRYAHRVAFQLFRGEIPADREIDHLCRNRGCVNPAHLDLVTRRENQLRGFSPAGLNARKTACPAGHSFAEGARYLRPDGKGSHCRVCGWARRAGLNPNFVTVEDWRSRRRVTD